MRFLLDVSIFAWHIEITMMTTTETTPSRPTTARSWSGRNWSGTVEVPTDLDSADQDAWYQAMGTLASAECYLLEDGVVYLADETGLWYRVGDADVLDLGRRYLAGDSDAYSEWCSDTPSTEYESLEDALGED